MTLSPRRASLGWALAALVVLVFSLVLAHRSLAPPPTSPSSAPTPEFSSGRALEHVKVLAHRPHRTGSIAHDEAKNYLERTLAALGLAPEVHASLVIDPRWERTRVVTVRNVIARIKGKRGSGKSVLLMAHYDSRGMAPGAGDDGLGTAALLETARAVLAGPRLANDVVFVWTDAEELGLLGARAFVRENPLAAEAGVVLNFDARGASGPALMFQTSLENGALIDALAQTPKPVAHALARTVYERMPNDTDLSVWLKERDVPALNFANVGGVARYHAATDDVARLDERTLAHHGAYALALTRAFGDRDLDAQRAPPATYFDFGPFFVRYPQAYDKPFAATALALASASAVLACFRRRARASRVAVGVFASPLVLALAFGVALAASQVILRADEPSLISAREALKDAHAVAGALLGLAVALASIAALSLVAKASELALGARVALGIGGVALALFVPGGAPLLAAPVLIASAFDLALALLRKGDDAPASKALALASAIPTALVLAPIALLLNALFGPPGAPLLAAVVALGSVALVPVLDLLLAPHRRIASGLVVAGALVALVVARFQAPFDADYPEPRTLLVGIDADKQSALWMTSDDANDAYTRGVLDGALGAKLPEFFPGSDAPTLRVKEAPQMAVEPPRASLIGDDHSATGTRRIAHFRVFPGQGTEMLVLYIQPEARITRARLQGRAVEVKSGALSIAFYGPPKDGFDLSCDTESLGSIRLRMVAQRAGFPSEAMEVLGPRPEGLMPRSGVLAPWDELSESGMTLVTREQSF